MITIEKSYFVVTKGYPTDLDPRETSTGVSNYACLILHDVSEIIRPFLGMAMMAGGYKRGPENK